MAEQDATSPMINRRKGRGLARSMWRAVRRPLARSRVVSAVLAWAIANYLRLVNVTNPWSPELSDGAALVRDYAPFIVAMWHGQHLMGPLACPRGIRVTAMFSRSADAEINARVAAKLGFDIVRGSGGRERLESASKGGARALLELKRVLGRGDCVGMIADIPHGKPREAGQGVILLAKLSGRPILPSAYASSRRWVVEKSWDKTTIPLPFGRAAALAAEPVFVPADADEALLEEKRVELTNKLNAITSRVNELAGAAG